MNVFPSSSSRLKRSKNDSTIREIRLELIAFDSDHLAIKWIDVGIRQQFAGNSQSAAERFVVTSSTRFWLGFGFYQPNRVISRLFDFLWSIKK